MSLVIETGAGISGANSYVTDNEYVSYAADRGLTIGSTATARKIELIKSMDYLFNRERNMRGTRTLDDQENIYPRENVYIRSVLLDSDAIPTELKNAQMEGGIAAKAFALLVNKKESNVKKSRLGQLEVEYFDSGSWETIRIERVDNYLRPLLVSGGISRTVRQ